MVEVYISSDYNKRLPEFVWFFLEGAPIEDVCVDPRSLTAGSSISVRDVAKIYDPSTVEDLLNIFSKDDLIKIYHSILEYVREESSVG